MAQVLDSAAEIQPNQTAVKKSSRGEQTRRQILQGALDILSKQGYRAVTHRAIAQAAGVNLSLTTYHFKDLEALINEAFRFYKQELLENFKGRWDRFYREQLNHLVGLDSPESRQALVEALSAYLRDAIVEDVALHPQGVAVEMTFNFDLHIKPEQRALAYNLCQRLYPQVLDVYQTFASAEPEVDALLLLDSVHLLRFRKLAVPNELSEHMIHQRLHRLLQLQFC